MDYNQDIEQLLERYWQCQTSPEEEQQLKRFFAGNDVPPHLMRYKSWFVYQQMQHETGLGEDFDKRILAQIEKAPKVKAKRITLTERFKPMLRAVAVVAVMLMLGNIMRHSFGSNENGVSLSADSISGQVNATPSVAVSEHTEAEQCTLPDSLAAIKKTEALKK